MNSRVRFTGVEGVEDVMGRVGEWELCGEGGVTSVWRIEVKIALACSNKKGKISKR